MIKDRVKTRLAQHGIDTQLDFLLSLGRHSHGVVAKSSRFACRRVVIATILKYPWFNLAPTVGTGYVGCFRDAMSNNFHSS